MTRNHLVFAGVLVAAAGALLVWGCSRSGAPGPQTVKVAVTERGFEPPEVTVHEGLPVTLLVTRKTDATCAKEIVIQGTNVRRELPLDQEVAVTFTPEKKGEVHYACPLNMITGTMKVQ